MILGAFVSIQGAAPPAYGFITLPYGLLTGSKFKITKDSAGPYGFTGCGAGTHVLPGAAHALRYLSCLLLKRLRFARAPEAIPGRIRSIGTAWDGIWDG